MNHLPRVQRGFSLLELALVVAVLAVLAAVAYPRYQAHLAQVRRSLVVTCLVENRLYLEMGHSLTHSYRGIPLQACPQGVSGHYAVGFLGEVDDHAYVMEAVPEGVQAEVDGRCGTLRLHHDGTREVTGSATDPERECW